MNATAMRWAGTADDQGPVAPDALVEAQATPGVTPTPERRLLLAILEQAIHDLKVLRATVAPRPHGRHRLATRRQLEAWFADAGPTPWPCGFENICAALGFDAGAIRARLGFSPAALRVAR